jgi:hypothetical protein
VVLEELDLTPMGNRLPQISFKVFRPLPDPDTAEGLAKAATMIPASGEFTYATVPVKKSSGSGSATVVQNLNAIPETPDIVVALSDWRDGFDHADAALAPAIYDRAYL